MANSTDPWTQPTLYEADREKSLLRVAHLEDQITAYANTLEVVQESLADAQLAFEDRGWTRLSMQAQHELSDSGRAQIRDLCRIMAVMNPLMKRGLSLRTAYIHGQGVTMTVRDQSDDGQDVNAVVQEFLDDPGNVKTFSGAQAHEEMERAAYTDGELAAALFTDPMTGRVQVRWLPVEQITDIITDPEDQVTVWYYKREYVERAVVGERMTEMWRTVYYPALGYEPPAGQRPRYIDGAEVKWDAPVRMVTVNRPTGSTRGIPDAFAAIPWARSYKEFLEQWSVLMKALARFAWQAKTRGDRAKTVAGKISAAPGMEARGGNPAGVGSTVVTDPNTTLEAIPKTGATIDADSGRPLAAMVAAALDVPVTMLLGDPGMNGARAVAETLDQPTELTMTLRRALWTEFRMDILNHVIDWAVRAPKGALKGTVRRERNRVLVELPDNDDRTIDISWPDFKSTPVDTLVKAIVEADGTMKLPPLVTLRLLLQALKVDDIDEILDEVTDDEGNYKDPEATAGQAAVDAFRQGRDPASLLGDDEEDDDPPADA
ncbi:hypothetical protein [Kribbella deserti]|uniref:Portal protein n=1 Tax=Kribbella deserti TaxID=1926257 RepID=A0ABV6QR21_9ACTN